MSRYSEEIINEAAIYYTQVLLSKAVYRLQRNKHGVRLRPDCDLKNFWEEICIQKQTDNWDGWFLVEDYIKTELLNLVEELPLVVQTILSYSPTEENGISQDVIVESLFTDLIATASNYSNKSIDRFLYDE